MLKKKYNTGRSCPSTELDQIECKELQARQKIFSSLLSKIDQILRNFQGYNRSNIGRYKTFFEIIDTVQTQLSKTYQIISNSANKQKVSKKIVFGKKKHENNPWEVAIRKCCTAIFKKINNEKNKIKKEKYGKNSTANCILSEAAKSFEREKVDLLFKEYKRNKQLNITRNLYPRLISKEENVDQERNVYRIEWDKQLQCVKTKQVVFDTLLQYTHDLTTKLRTYKNGNIENYKKLFDIEIKIHATLSKLSQKVNDNNVSVKEMIKDYKKTFSEELTPNKKEFETKNKSYFSLLTTFVWESNEPTSSDILIKIKKEIETKLNILIEMDKENLVDQSIEFNFSNCYQN